MASIGKWNAPGSLASVMTTELNSLGTNPSTMAKTTTPYDNGTNLDIYVEIELVLAAAAFTSGAYCTLYRVETVDGTNYPAQSGADMRLTSTQMMCVIPIGVTNAQQRVVVPMVMIPPTKFHVWLDNQTGVALASSGNTLKFLPYNYNLNG